MSPKLKDTIKYLQSGALREHICKLEEGERERRQGLKAPHEGQKVDNLRKASGMLLGKQLEDAGSFRDTYEHSTAYLSQWKSETNLATLFCILCVPKA